MKMGKMNCVSSFGFFAVLRSLLVLFCVLKCISGDEVSIGVSTCTKLNDKGDPVEFFCPDSLSLSKHYCCGVRNFQYCCDYDDHEAFSAAAVAAFIIGPIVVLLCICATICWCCSCCCFARNRPQHIILTQPLSSTSTTMHQPMFVPQGYHQLGNAHNPQASTTQVFQSSPAPLGKPPPYNN